MPVPSWRAPGSRTTTPNQPGVIPALLPWLSTPGTMNEPPLEVWCGGGSGFCPLGSPLINRITFRAPTAPAPLDRVQLHSPRMRRKPVAIAAVLMIVAAVQLARHLRWGVVLTWTDPDVDRAGHSTFGLPTKYAWNGWVWRVDGVDYPLI